MLDKIKKAIKKIIPTKKKVVSNMDDLDSGVGVNQEVKSQSKLEVKSDTKSSLTFGK